MPVCGSASTGIFSLQEELCRMRGGLAVPGPPSLQQACLLPSSALFLLCSAPCHLVSQESPAERNRLLPPAVPPLPTRHAGAAAFPPAAELAGSA